MERALATLRQGAALAAAAGAAWVAFGPATAVALAWNVVASWTGVRAGARSEGGSGDG